MSSVHYKFKNSLEYDTYTFDGIHITVGELKKGIIQQKKMGKSTDVGLQISNAQSQDVYTNDDMLIPKNSSILVSRVQAPNISKTKPKLGYGGDTSNTMGKFGKSSIGGLGGGLEHAIPFSVGVGSRMISGVRNNKFATFNQSRIQCGYAEVRSRCLWQRYRYTSTLATY